MAQTLTDMKRAEPDESAGADAMPCCGNEQYPYGLNIRLGEEEIAKLGLKGLPAVGSEVHGIFVSQVTSASQEAGDESERGLSLQITLLQLDVEPAGSGESSETPANEYAEIKGTFRPAKRPAVIVD